MIAEHQSVRRHGAAPAMPRQRAATIADAFQPSHRLGNRWHYYYAREKLASDPLFPAVVDALRGSDAPLLDIGCGIGLLAHVLRADGQPVGYRGVDIDAIKIGRARRAARRAALPATGFESIDLTRALPSHRGSVAILDVLQYLDAAPQDALLDAATAMLAPGGRLVIRAALDDGGHRSFITRATDRLGHLAGWMQSIPKCYPTADALRARFDADATLQSRFAPLYGRTPFNHWLIVVERIGAR